MGHTTATKINMSSDNATSNSLNPSHVEYDQQHQLVGCWPSWLLQS